MKKKKGKISFQSKPQVNIHRLAKVQYPPQIHVKTNNTALNQLLKPKKMKTIKQRQSYMYLGGDVCLH